LPAYPKKSPLEEKKQYYQELATQISYKDAETSQKRETEEQQQIIHFKQWDAFWGRPGGGAPRSGGHGQQKENLMKNLHYPSTKVIILGPQ
jgi:hypothetical protein